MRHEPGFMGNEIYFTIFLCSFKSTVEECLVNCEISLRIWLHEGIVAHVLWTTCVE
ncbi:hypothetical protein PAAL109150_21765 [Paenibacillus alkaliterrae]